MLTDSRSCAAHGEMATRFAEFDWSKTPLGPVERWPESWRNAVTIILDSSFPTALGLGSELIYFYNDAFIPLAGPARHPGALGLPVPLAWKEIWPQILQPRLEYTLRTGMPTGEADLMMPLERSGYLEETYVTFSFAALRDAHSRPNGIFCTAIETTARVIADRQLLCLRALAAQGSLAETPEAACQSAVNVLEAYERDMPFALLYLVERDGRRARLAGTVGLAMVPETVPTAVDFTQASDAWQLATVATAGVAAPLENVQLLIGSVTRIAEVTPVCATALPIASRGEAELAAILIAGANPMRPLQESRTFHTLIAGHLETAISNARAKQHVQERARALAELDRAKTVFFSNISHELRTPLTLLLAPLDETLARGKLDEKDREALVIARRGGSRLLKLVNSLLEFSRIEAGRIQATYVATDLAAVTADLASMFRSAFERSGIALRIDCPTLPEPAYVDRDMWEKIVLNLLSNALKFTFSGEVSITLRSLSEHIQLEVSDSGCGIAPEDLSRAFERFFRGRAAQTRTHEGSGIGLSLVQELVKLHGGSIEAASELGRGTTMTVRIPRGSSHLDPERIGSSHNAASFPTVAHTFVEEALGWLPDAPRAASDAPAPVGSATTSESESDPLFAPPAHILVVDDNADMRSYLCRLLRRRGRTSPAADGVAALALARQQLPELIIADVMMPRLDGFGLLRALRDDPATAQVPVMLLSARAAEEASAEGLRAGADDYVTKPFNACELLARVDSRLAQARARAAERKSREIAVRANQARDDFFAMLSHELRTPLMAVLAWTALLRGDVLSREERADALEIIERNARAQRYMIDDLLDVSRIVTGRMRIEAQPISSLGAVVATVVDSFSPLAAAKGLTVVTHLANAAGPLRADPERLQQVVWNLLANAIQFTPGGGRIEVRCSRRDSQVVLSVRDTGRGISPEAIPHLFERYWQGDPARRHPHGLGLGLAITHRLVELHSGSIEAASDGEGRGAVFTVRLPVAEDLRLDDVELSRAFEDLTGHDSARARMEDAAITAAACDCVEPLPACLDKRAALRILFVEDHDGVARATQRLLASHGHAVIRAASAEEALLLLKRESVDLLICDVGLPDGSGLELLSRLRAQLGSPRRQAALPAIAISGNAYQEEVQRCMAAGFSAHLAKPFGEDVLLDAIAAVTAKEAGESIPSLPPDCGDPWGAPGNRPLQPRS